MYRVNEFRLFELGAALQPLTELRHDQDVGAAARFLLPAQRLLQRTLTDNLVPLRSSRPAGLKLEQMVNDLIEKLVKADPSKPTPLIGNDSVFLRFATQDFETVLAAELAQMDTYYVSQKGIWFTPDLIEGADRSFPGQIRTRLTPDAVTDIRRAGRCLAFDLPTAAGFHIIRATEAVLRQYHDHVTNGNARPKNRDWGSYIRVIRRHPHNPKVIGIVDQIRDMHRNPLIHPEVTLEPEEAAALFNICQSAITALVSEIHGLKKGNNILDSAG